MAATPDFQALSSTLSAMSLPQIQQYASLHKNDPYVVAMAMSVANTKKEAMTAEQAKQQQQPQEKVVDQAIAGIDPLRHAAAQMAEAQRAMPQTAQTQAPAETPTQQSAQQLPEEQGIGQLPAPNMERMAEGGIVGFDGGGAVTQGQVQDAYNQWQAMQPSYFSQQTPTSAQKLAAAEQNYRNLYQQYVGQPSQQPGAQPTPQPDPQTALSQLLAQKNQAAQAQSNAQDVASAIQNSNAAAAGANAAQQRPAPPPTPSAPPSPAAGANNITGAQPNPQAQGIGALPNANDVMSQLASAYPQAAAPNEEDIQTRLGGMQKEFFERADEKAKEQRDKLDNDRQMAIYQAMLKGGFKMMAGTSPWGMVNVGAGGAAAAEDLGESFKDLRKAAQEQDRMEMELAKAKMDASTGNLKTAWDRTDKANQLNADRNKALVSAGATIQSTNINAHAGIQEALIHKQAALEAAGIQRESMKDYRTALIDDARTKQVQDMYKNHYAEVVQDPRFKLDAVKAQAEVNRRMQQDLKFYPALAQYYNPTTGGASGASTSNAGWGQAKIVP